MAFYQVDSSALVKRYITERGSAWMRSLASVGTRNRLGLARITIVEVASALARKHREGEIGRQDRDVAVDVFLNDCRQEYQVLETGPALVERAVALTQVHPLRAYDAVQLAAALIVHERLVANGLLPATFISADARLCALGAAEGLQVENPNDHP